MSGSSASDDAGFAVKDCALIAIATGRKAFSLRELRDVVESIPSDSLYHHMWGGLLEPRFEEREYHNDFASWARHGLHDGVLAERLAMVSPIEFRDLESLRLELIDLIEQRLDESERLHWVQATYALESLRSQIVVFDTGVRVHGIEQLATTLPHLSTSSIFYHFIDARRRHADARDDFTVWIASLPDAPEGLCWDLSQIDPYFSSLGQVREALCQAVSRNRARKT